MASGAVSMTCGWELVSQKLAESEPGPPPGVKPPESQNWRPNGGLFVLVRSFHSTSGAALVILAGLIHPSIVNPGRVPRSSSGQRGTVMLVATPSPRKDRNTSPVTNFGSPHNNPSMPPKMSMPSSSNGHQAPMP